MSDDQFFWTYDPDEEPPPHWGPPIRLRLERYVGDTNASSQAARKPVLLLHGASACHRTFTVPGVGLAPWLYENGFDPWLLDWRGSHLVVEGNPETLATHPHIFNFNRAAMEDLPAAIHEMRRRGGVGPIGLLGHCMGSTTIAEAVALGHVGPPDVDSIVLSALGLFYEAPIDGRIKSEERVLERLIHKITNHPEVAAIDPRTDESGQLKQEWPEELSRLYEAWPDALKSHAEEGMQAEESAPAMPRHTAELCNRLAFMFGSPYHHRQLAESIHGTGSIEPVLPDQFGGIPTAMYLNAASNLRAGRARIFDKELQAHYSNDDFISDSARANFRALKVTMVTGALNRLWHRDSIDRMYDWLCRGSFPGLNRVSKHVFPDYAHQDLWWGRKSTEEIYPTVKQALS